jgi:hypothetical protein
MEFHRLAFPHLHLVMHELVRLRMNRCMSHSHSPMMRYVRGDFVDLREIDLMKISHRNAIHYLIKPVNGHPWD